MTAPNSNSVCSDDELPLTAAEPWVKTKVEILQQYVSAFVGSLAGKVNDIIFVDLYAGNGMYSLGARKEIFAGHGLATLAQDLPITKFILCEKDMDQFKILKIRVNRSFRNKNVVLLEGKPDALIDKLQMYVPLNKGDYRSAVICICDPFSLDTSFHTIDTLSAMGFSFLMPFTFAISDRLDYRHYLNEGRERIKKFLGGYRDIDRLSRDAASNIQFYKRLIRIYENNILSLGLNASNSVHKLDSGLMELPVYYIGFFSKAFSTRAIQEEVAAAGQIQYGLFQSEAS